jgi:hypothetical protein
MSAFPEVSKGLTLYDFEQRIVGQRGGRHGS